jgi:hypothetical protein
MQVQAIWLYWPEVHKLQGSRKKVSFEIEPELIILLNFLKFSFTMK